MKTNKNANPAAEAVRDLLLQHHLTLAVAESVTCGLLQASFSAVENTSRFFQGGITAYNLGQKVRHLGVEPIHAEEYNCVSETVAIQMARQVAVLFSASVGIGITGYATPLPELGITDRFAYLAVVRNGELLLCDLITTNRKEALAVQKDFCRRALRKTHEALLR